MVGGCYNYNYNSQKKSDHLTPKKGVKPTKFIAFNYKFDQLFHPASTT